MHAQETVKRSMHGAAQFLYPSPTWNCLRVEKRGKQYVTLHRIWPAVDKITKCQIWNRKIIKIENDVHNSIKYQLKY